VYKNSYFINCFTFCSVLEDTDVTVHKFCFYKKKKCYLAALIHRSISSNQLVST
jgi:hypothetical protein